MGIGGLLAMNAKLRLSLSLLLVLVVLSGCSLFEGRPGTARVVLMLADETPLAGVELALLDGNIEAGKVQPTIRVLWSLPKAWKL